MTRFASRPTATKLGVSLFCLVQAACGGADSGPGDTPDDDTPSPANFVWPTYTVSDGYAHLDVAGWTVHLGQALVEDRRTLGAAVVEHLQADLDVIVGAVPPSALPALRGVPIWIELAQPDFPGGAYHPSADWLTERGYPAAWARGIMLGNAANYLDWTRVQPAIVLHELAHAWHDQQLGFDDVDVKQVYDQAVASGSYETVFYAGGGTREAYALTNEREYFAELSEAWFWRNDFTPFVRSELTSWDPQGAALMQSKWPAP